DVLETTVGLATSRAGATWRKGRPALPVDASGHCGCSKWCWKTENPPYLQDSDC
ncbi:uncharacterized protein FOBCDRAFT_227376, partial [Fusarium oxysporum Fo47]|uniref:uncharacterized protein n=1 Tax=Fusarium oxysporum Fo47 TaxID=660027 RepID=UPI002869BCDE